ncbi:isochorismate synthase [Deinococcus ficus]|uniref:isochorismate synthase n=1 Tax=Deinococcus ficus TaxID=317577 RepID=UPI00174CE611|nr:isochorismate synthase [Deinococcus ficus]GHF85531.1 isochorismate synthase DhbC [Deinococcus ficus]
MSLAAPLPTPAHPLTDASPFRWHSPEVSLSAGELWTPPVPAGLSTGDHGRALLRAARQAGAPGACVVGALPFHPDEPAALAVAPTPDRAAPRPQPPGAPSRPLLVQDGQSVPPAAEFETMVERAVQAIHAGALEKVVLGRLLHLDLGGPPPCVTALVDRLAVRHPAGFTFALRLPGRPDRTLVGASPELLVCKCGATVTLRPMAGTRARHPDPRTDGALAADLLGSAKDRAEHAVMVEAIRSALAPLCRTLDVPDRPNVTSTATLWHLVTPITAELRDPACSVLDVVERLHPTPAVGGVPGAAARAFIREHEPFARGLFAGAVGWCDARGDGEWAVTIRCAEIGAQAVRLFAGAGVVGDSVPALERAETAAKFRTMLDALGLDARTLGGAL